MRFKNGLQCSVKCANKANMTRNKQVTFEQTSRFFASRSTLDNENSSIIGIKMVCKAAPEFEQEWNGDSH